MTTPTEIVGIDFETRSQADLKALGSWAYAQHESTETICAVIGVSKPGVRTKTHRWWMGDILPSRVVDLFDGSRPVVAHNIGFERSILAHSTNMPDWPDTEELDWLDTADLARLANLPASLDALTKLLPGVTHKATADGRRLIDEYCRPQRDGSFAEITAADKGAFLDYCALDVVSMCEAFWALVGHVTPVEWAILRADARVNRRGVCLDTHYALSILAAARRRGGNLDARIKVTTRGKVGTATNPIELKEWVGARTRLPKTKRANGKMSETLDRNAIGKMITDPVIDPDLRDVLEIRLEASRLTSIAKLNRIEDLCDEDHRASFLLVAHGAHTGRWSSKTLQLHNLPKDGRDAARAAAVTALLVDPDRGPAFAKLEALCGSNLTPDLSQALRGIVVAPPGRVLIGADYSAIEARVLAWLADADDVLDIFRSGRDIYVEDAKAIGSDNRQLGKVCRLALGYGMGAATFAETGARAGINMSLGAWSAVQQAWRDDNPKIVAFWHQIEEAFRCAIKKPGKPIPVGSHLRITGRKSRVEIRLPSSRVINYWRPRLVQRDKTFTVVGENGLRTRKTSTVSVIEYYKPTGIRMVDDETYFGKLAENVSSAVARDLLGVAIARLERHPTYDPVMHVHDSIVAEVDTGNGDIGEFCDLMTRLPPWAAGLPLAAEGYRSHRFQG